MYITFYIVHHYHTYHTTLLNNSLIIPKVAKGLSVMASSFMHGKFLHARANKYFTLSDAIQPFASYR